MSKPLTKRERDALPAEHFAVPGKRELPFHDSRHLKMAWSMLPRTQDLSNEERRKARTRILHRAKELGVDTEDWELHSVAFQIEAMSLNVPDDPDHSRTSCRSAASSRESTSPPTRHQVVPAVVAF